jgi:hypothetical protein
MILKQRIVQTNVKKYENIGTKLQSLIDSAGELPLQVSMTVY